VASNDVVEAM